jgi:hypothetical protein
MDRIIVDIKKITPEIFTLLNEKYPDGYNDNDIIVFENHHNEIIEAVEVNTDDATYLVKVHSKLHYTMANFNSDDMDIDELGNIVFDKEDEEE